MAPPDLIDLRSPDGSQNPRIVIENVDANKHESDSEDVFMTPLNSLYIDEEAFYSTLPEETDVVPPASADTSGEIEQCLMELDNYLQSLDNDEPAGNVNQGFVLDETRPVRPERRRPASAGRESRNFCRRNPLRSTWTAPNDRLTGSDQDLHVSSRRDWSWIQDVAVPDVVAQAWLRRSMRRAQPIVLQEDEPVSNLLSINPTTRTNSRPMSAPVQVNSNSLVATAIGQRPRSSSASSRSRRAASLSSTDTGSDTSVESSCADSVDQSGYLLSRLRNKSCMEELDNLFTELLANITQLVLQPTLLVKSYTQLELMCFIDGNPNGGPICMR
ncbi:uncharacterized protein LOC113380596 [Ctenocephalides felis]|uniref:uncharacterized protein LOC113380596 n=1 Tax=Ctenocephalides felis TaxID=7515 RepID=UPI000E6E5A9D|nr:uncharacterized protein LOC113380596 [Ctenocephalides felis]